MGSPLSAEIRRIFVGRRAELAQLAELWSLAQEEAEHLVYVLLNAPGVGKTMLLREFGSRLERACGGLFLYVNCATELCSREDLVEYLLDCVRAALETKGEHIRELIREKTNFSPQSPPGVLGPSHKAGARVLERVEGVVREIFDRRSFDLRALQKVLHQLARVIPVYIAIDEVQELQAFKFPASTFTDPNAPRRRGEETALHFLARALKMLLNSRIFLVLSGTRYRILSQIGEKIGSPLQGKVRPLLLGRFSLAELKEYVHEVQRMIRDSPPTLGAPATQLQQYHEYHHRFLQAFSGGHPRTVEIITTLYLELLSTGGTPSRPLQFDTYESFCEVLLPQTIEYIEDTLLTTNHRAGLLALEAREGFPVIREWLQAGASAGLELGPRPSSKEEPTKDEELKRLTHELVNLGIIVQNGRANYYLTSYYHLLAFLNTIRGPHEAFLREILTNRFFKYLCGWHAGFGHTFEHVLATAILTRPLGDLPREFPPVETIKIVPGRPELARFEFEEAVLYHFPDAVAVDLAARHGPTLLWIQVTSARNPPVEKVDALLRTMDEYQALHSRAGTKAREIHGWVVSLFPFATDPTTGIHEERANQVTISAGKSLRHLLGREVYARLVSVKKFFAPRE